FKTSAGIAPVNSHCTPAWATERDPVSKKKKKNLLRQRLRIKNQFSCFIEQFGNT
uniref:Uncharacterized protein n=1 Tax=Monodon monoceros TaxID=40151 RepID=A0A8C6AXJ9_MONMO